MTSLQELLDRYCRRRWTHEQISLYTCRYTIVAILAGWMSKASRLRRCLVTASGSGSLSRSGCMSFSVLLRSKVIKRVCRPLLIEKDDIIVDFLLYRFSTGDMEIHKKLCFDPSIDGFHRSVVRRSSGT